MAVAVAGGQYGATSKGAVLEDGAAENCWRWQVMNWGGQARSSRGCGSRGGGRYGGGCDGEREGGVEGGGQGSW